MSDAHVPNAVIDYARVSADEERLGRYLRFVLGSALLFYGGCGTIASALYYATSYRLLDTGMAYDDSGGTFIQHVNTATTLAMIIAGPSILWGSRGIVVAAGFLARFASAVTIIAFICTWAWNLGQARRASTNFDAWYWIAAFVGSAAYLVIPMLIGLLAKAPAFTRICAVARSG